MRALTLLLALLLAGCPAAEEPLPPPVQELPPVAQPEPEPEPEPEPVVQPDPVAPPLVSAAGRKLIIDFEVGGRATYDRRYQRPICPACSTTASGPTVGIGYDLGHQRPDVIREDWVAHPERDVLVTGAGLGRANAITWTRAHQHVVTPWPLADAVFSDATLPVYWRIARNSFGPAFEEAPQSVRDALVSVVYNRGGSMVGPARLEMRIIRDTCLPHDTACVAHQLRAMTRIWKGGSIEAGMTRRRYAEAALAESM